MKLVDKLKKELLNMERSGNNKILHLVMCIETLDPGFVKRTITKNTK